MLKHLFFVFVLLSVSGCNSVYVKPNSLDPNATFFAMRGGYGMQRTIKEVIQKHGHKIVVGKAKANSAANDGNSTSINIKQYEIPTNVKYIVDVTERKELLRPIWCAFNGFWWWNFNVSIANQLTGEEIMTWRGRGCINSSVRKLENILDEMEIK